MNKIIKYFGVLLHIIYMLIQQNTGYKTVHALCELHLHSSSDKLIIIIYRDFFIPYGGVVMPRAY